jgi:threonine aldolase
MFGGAMRQIGILAAAGLYALEHNISRMGDDHRHAGILVKGLEKIAGLDFDATSGKTNMVFFDLQESPLTVDGFLSRCKEQGLLLCPFGGRRIRAVTHLDISADDCERALGIIERVLQQ